MTWTGKTFNVGDILTAAQMNNLQGDITAQAQGDAGAPAQLWASMATSETSVTSMTVSAGTTVYLPEGYYIISAQAGIGSPTGIDISYKFFGADRKVMESNAASELIGGSFFSPSSGDLAVTAVSQDGILVYRRLA